MISRQMIGPLILISALTGCGTAGERKILDSWQGAKINDVIRHWGIPSRSMKLEGGQTMYEWGDERTVSVPSFTSGTVNYGQVSAITSPSTFHGSCSRSFIADAGGVIVDGMARGDNCCFMAVAGHCASLINPARAR